VTLAAGAQVGGGAGAVTMALGRSTDNLGRKTAM
jgi:hypothetical protein